MVPAATPSPAALGSTEGSDLRRVAVLGGTLVVIRSIIGALTVWLLPVSHQNRLESAVDFAVTAALAAATLALPWHRLPRSMLVVYPVIGITGLAVLGLLTTGVGPVYTAFLVFVFIYAGSTGSTRGVLTLLIPCAVTWTLLNGVTHTGMTAALGIRLAITVSVWTVIGVLLARRTGDERSHRADLIDAARTDALTGLDNRRNLDHVLAAVRPGDTVLAVDIDRFRDINTTRGHSGGDTVLAEFGRTLRVGLRGDDRAIRLGGDEFVLVLNSVSEVQVLSVLSRVREQWQHHCGPVTFSAGAATAGRRETGQEALLRADQHCYTAKDAGRDQWILDDSDPGGTRNTQLRADA